ncbi:MAG TPA: tetratricopeptide repeat protein [Pyrinomonadaceae bacterium]|nr:tetratricopeptide repeat protein [Pyrinomonadaceae bacterium]
MTDWLRLLLMIFYAPLRGMREARDRGSLAPIALIAVLSQFAFNFASRRFGGATMFPRQGIIGQFIEPAMPVVLIAVVLVPILTLIANTVERRGSFRVVITQEYAPVAAALFYVLTAANLFAILMAAFLHYTGIQAQYVASAIQQADQVRAMFPQGPEFDEAAGQLRNPAILADQLFRTPRLFLFAIGMVLAVKDAFRTSAMRAVAITLVASFVSIFVFPLVARLLSGVFGSPFLLLMLFFLLRGYFSDFMGSHRAKAAFRQNLETATLNPADASAHYNLGLIHQTRGELEDARKRFERALQIDDGEIDASYQLGRIALQQKRYADAIQNFEHVVARDPAHAQYEIWREVAATYIAAGQFEDARNALDQFLEHRPSDPEGLYLMGRAHAGLGHKREATSLMQACIEAVKTAPAYKYRTSKRWLNEAQQFIKSSQ